MIITKLCFPATYVWIIMLAAFKIFCDRRYWMLLVPGVVIIYTATLLLGPTVLQRYGLPAEMAAPLILAVSFYVKEVNDGNPERQNNENLT